MPQIPPPPPPFECSDSKLKITKVSDASGKPYEYPFNEPLMLKTSTITVEFIIEPNWGTNAYIQKDSLPVVLHESDPAPPTYKFIWTNYNDDGDNQKIHINADSYQLDNGGGLHHCHSSAEVQIKVVRAAITPAAPAPQKIPAKAMAQSAPAAPPAAVTMTFPHDQVVAGYTCQFGLLAFGDILRPPVSMRAVMYNLANMTLPAKVGKLIQTTGATWIVRFDYCHGYTGRVAVVSSDVPTGYTLSAAFFINGC